MSIRYKNERLTIDDTKMSPGTEEMFSYFKDNFELLNSLNDYKWLATMLTEDRYYENSKKTDNVDKTYFYRIAKKLETNLRAKRQIMIEFRFFNYPNFFDMNFEDYVNKDISDEDNEDFVKSLDIYEDIIKNGRNINALNTTIMPFKEKEIYIDLCKKLGKHYDLGSIFSDLSKMKDNYRKAVRYFFGTILETNSDSAYRKARDNIFKYLNEEKKIPFDEILRSYFTDSDKNRQLYTLDMNKIVKQFVEYLFSMRNKKITGIDEIDKMIKIVIKNEERIKEYRSTNNIEVIKDILPSFFSFTSDNFIGTNYGQKQNEYRLSFTEVLKYGTSNFNLYWWQEKAVEKAVLGKSFVLSGPTSGGKTYCSMLIMAKLLIDFQNTTESKTIVYSAPTDELACQTYANMLSFEGIQNRLGLLSSSASIVSDNTSIFIGTPKEIKDFFDQKNQAALRKTYETVEDKFRAYMSDRKYRNIDIFICDEIHTLSNQYDNTLLGQTICKSIDDIISNLPKSCQVIGLSASLSENSLNNLVYSLIEKLSGSNEELDEDRVETIVYEYKNAFLLSENDKPLNIDGNMQVKYVVTQKDNTIQEFNKSDQLKDKKLDQIEVNSELLVKMLHKCRALKVSPGGFFFDNEIEAISALKNLLVYINDYTFSSSWLLSKKIMGEVAGEVAKNHIIEKIKETATDPKYKLAYVDKEIFSKYIEYYNKTVDRELFEMDNIFYNIELYAYLVEYYDLMRFNSYTMVGENLEIKGKAFTRDIHPFFRFGEMKDLVFLPEEEQKFNELLTSQVGKENISLVELISKSLKHGIGLVISSIPVSFQLRILILLKQINAKNDEKKDISREKKDKSYDENNIGFIFCDDCMSSGVDFPLRCTVSIKNKLSPIPTPKFIQRSGRSGRNQGTGNFQKGYSFLINVSNYEELNFLDELDFDNQKLVSNFYNHDNVYSAMKKMCDFIISDRIDMKIFDDFVMFPQINVENLNNQEKIPFIKKHIREMFELIKNISGDIAINKIQKFFLYFQKISYTIVMDSAV